MEEMFKNIASNIALAVELIGILVIAAGALQAMLRVFFDTCKSPFKFGWRRKVWVDFGIWLMLGLQFLLAADIVRSAISPTWENIGQLAAIAAIRTFLNYFLEQDISKMEGEGDRIKPREGSEEGAAT